MIERRERVVQVPLRKKMTSIIKILTLLETLTETAIINQ